MPFAITSWRDLKRTEPQKPLSIFPWLPRSWLPAFPPIPLSTHHAHWRHCLPPNLCPQAKLSWAAGLLGTCPPGVLWVSSPQTHLFLHQTSFCSSQPSQGPHLGQVTLALKLGLSGSSFPDLEHHRAPTAYLSLASVSPLTHPTVPLLALIWTSPINSQLITSWGLGKSRFTSLSFNYPLCKIGIMTSLQRAVVRMNSGNICKLWYLAPCSVSAKQMLMYLSFPPLLYDVVYPLGANRILRATVCQRHPAIFCFQSPAARVLSVISFPF